MHRTYTKWPKSLFLCLKNAQKNALSPTALRLRPVRSQFSNPFHQKNMPFQKMQEILREMTYCTQNPPYCHFCRQNAFFLTVFCHYDPTMTSNKNINALKIFSIKFCVRNIHSHPRTTHQSLDIEHGLALFHPRNPPPKSRKCRCTIPWQAISTKPKFFISPHNPYPNPN